MWENGCKTTNSTTAKPRKPRSKKKVSPSRKKATKASKPAHQSKIITLAVTTGVAYLGTKYGIDIPAEWQTEIESGIVVVGLGGIAVIRRWYTDQDLH